MMLVCFNLLLCNLLIVLLVKLLIESQFDNDDAFDEHNFPNVIVSINLLSYNALFVDGIEVVKLEKQCALFNMSIFAS